MAGKELYENPKTPNINFLSFQNELRAIVDDIKAHQSKSPLKKMFAGKKGNPHVDGSILLDAAKGDKQCAKFVSMLSKDSTNAAARLQLVNAVMGIRKDHLLKTQYAMMLQAAIPIYMGDITPTFMQLVVHTYRAYLERLSNLHKQSMMSIKSTALKNVNMSGIDVDDEDEDDANVRDTEAMKTEIQVSEALVENCEAVMSSIKTKMTTSLSHEEIEELTAEGKAASSFFGGGEEKVNPNKQNMIIGKAVQAIEMLKQIPLLQGAGLDLSQQLGRIDNKLTYPLVMEGRIHMQALKFQLLRIECNDRGARDNMAPVYNKAVVAYRKAMKLTSKSAPKKGDLPVLTEFANVTHYGFVHRDLMRFTLDGVKGLVKLGKEAVDAAVTVDESFAPLQKRLDSSVTQLDNAKK